MGDIAPYLAIAMVLLVVVPAAVVAIILLAKPLFRWLTKVVVHIVTFIGREVGDILRIIGAVLTSIVLLPIVGVNLLLGRWSSASHYGSAIKIEMLAMLGCVYRVLIGNPARLFLLTALTEGLETRIPNAIAHAPGAFAGSGRQSQFDGYTIVGTLQGGGSGAKLYIAEPTVKKIAALAREGQHNIARCVIKAFSLSDGSTLAQIVRENRALPAAKRLGLILEHELTEEKFFYVTRYVPGESLVAVTHRLHALGGGADGLGDGPRLKEAMSYAADILRTISRYHTGGLWHKDVKPDNIIVHERKAELVDFGLVTPLRSSMTLTTHGTEYFRDPEMVRMALRGVKVHEVDGAKFDIYASGAVLYSMIENSFPAHGGLSQISRKCPEALRWIVRRAMTDYDKRYDSAAAMLADVETVLAAEDPFTLRPADLPSVRADQEGGIEPTSRVLPIPAPDAEEVGGTSIGTDGRAARRAPLPKETHPELPADLVGPDVAEAAVVMSPNLRVVNWWSGRYAVDPAPLAGMAEASALGRERVRAKGRRSGRRAMRWGTGGGEKGLSRGARLAIGVAIVALLANLAWLIGGGMKKSPIVEAVARVRQTFGLGSGQTSPGPTLGRVLILWDAAALGPAALRQMDDRINRLAAAGFEIVGTATAAANAQKALEEAKTIDELRTRIGMAAFRSDDASIAIRNWLGDHADLEMVIWIRCDEAKRPDPWLLSREGADPMVLNAATRAFGEGGRSRG